VKIVGLKIGRERVAASIIDQGLRQAELKDCFSLPFASDAELADILRTKSEEWHGARIVSSIPGSQFSQRRVSFPFGDRKRIQKALPFELEDNIPFALDDVEIDHLVLEQTDAGDGKRKETNVLGLMLPKTALRQHLDLLASASVDPQVVVPSYLGLFNIAKTIPVEGVAVLVEGGDICLKVGNAVMASRSFSRSLAMGGIRHTLKALETELKVQIERAYLLAPDDGLRKELADLGLAVQEVSPDFRGKKAEDAVSLGLALSEQVNFRKGEFGYRLEDAGKRKRRTVLIAVAAAAVVLAAANIGIKYYLVQSSYGKLDREIKEVFHQTLPNAKSAADPVRQLRTSLEDARKKFGVLGSGTSALDVMQAVTEGIPKEVRVSFQDFLLEGDRLKLAGDVASFESVDKMKVELQKIPSFAEVQVLDTRMGADNKVKFRLEIKLKQSM
jgi:general secretion pathway protein L